MSEIGTHCAVTDDRFGSSPDDVLSWRAVIGR